MQPSGRLLRPAPKDRHIDLLFDALDSDDSNEVVITSKSSPSSREVPSLPADFPKPKPKLGRSDETASSRAGGATKNQDPSIQQSEREENPQEKKAIDAVAGPAPHRLHHGRAAALREST